MTTKAHPVFVLCEGSHDIVLLTRLIRAGLHATPLDAPVQDLPAPLGRFFVTRFAQRSVQDATLGSQGLQMRHDPPVLESAWQAPNELRHWYFLNCGGDTARTDICIFLEQLITLTEIPEQDKGLSALTIIFVNDANSHGVAQRLVELSGFYGETLRKIIPTFLSFGSNQVHRHERYSTCAGVFAGPDGFGTLENVIWPLMHATANQRHSDSMLFLDKHASSASGVSAAGSESKRLKAALSIAGQPECPGASLAVVLRETGALDDSVLTADATCMQFLELLKSA